MEEEAPPIDVEDFKDQPLGKEDGMRIAGMISEWDKVLRHFKSNTFDLVIEANAAMADVALGGKNTAARSMFYSNTLELIAI